MLKIIHAVLHTSVQDAGRHHLRHLGISQSGALDMPALSIANLLVDNAMSEAGLEITLGKFAATFTSSCWIALTGADSHAELDGKPIWTGWRFHVKAGQTLRLRMPRRGMRSYLAISGGLGLPDVLGSLSTDLKAGFGGYLGRPLRDGDALPLKKAAYRKPHKPVGIKQILFTNRVRVLPGPEYHEFSEEARDTFWRTGWQLSPQSNRMGYRLQGPALARITPRELFSHGVLPGVIQVPPNGQPILLLADAQTTGGYPRIACVIDADLFHLVQIRLGEPIHFIPCTLDDALRASQAQAQRRYLEQLAWRLNDY